MSEPAENMESIDSFVQFPPEIRMMMIDKMEPDDRCRFGASSKLCNKDSKNSKNYIYGLDLLVTSQNTVVVYVRYMSWTETGDNYSSRYFLSLQSRKYIREECTNKRLQMNRRLMWEVDMDNSVDVFQSGIEYFNSYLKRYQNIIRRIELNGDIPENIDFEVDSLTNLEVLRIHDNDYGSQFISKTHHPLKELVITSGNIDESDMEKIFQVQQKLDVPSLQLNISQFLQLSATDITTHIGQLTPEHIFNYLKSWQKGEREISAIEWCLENSNFNAEQLFRLFESFIDPSLHYNPVVFTYRLVPTPEKTFKHFSELPCDVRMMISDEMNPVDRCRFSGCSKLSNLEAKASKNYMHTL